jgi:competence protein ComQ
MTLPFSPGLQYSGPIETANALLEALFSQVPGVRGYATDVSLALRSSRAGESTTTPFVLLPHLCCQAVGGDTSRSIPVMAAWYALMLAARILDDLEDGDTDGTLWAQLGAARAANVATGLILAAPLALLQLQKSGVSDSQVLALIQDTQRAALHVCAGQQDTLLPNEVWGQAWENAEAKAGEPFALACRAGALVGEGTVEQITHLSEFGQHLGVLTQIADDVSDTWQARGRSDLAAGRKTLPVMYALAMATPAASCQLRQLLDQTELDTGAVLQAQQMVAETGALHVLVIEAELRRQRAERALQAAHANVAAQDQLLELVEQTMGWMKRGTR